MADDPNPASVNVNDRRAETRSAAIGATGAAFIGQQSPADPSADQPMVKVKPIASYIDSALNEHKSPDSEPYEVSRQRATELRANMLVEYASDADEKSAIEAQVRAAGDKKRAEIDARKNPSGAGPKLSDADAAKAKAPPAGSHPPIKTAG